MMTDPIADMLTRIRNATMVQKEMVDIPASNMKLAIANILEKEGYIREYRKIEDNKQGVLRIILKYAAKGENVIHKLKKVSVPSRRKYLKATDIEEICGGLGISIFTTSQGVLTGREARRRNVGGELLCEIW